MEKQNHRTILSYRKAGNLMHMAAQTNCNCTSYVGAVNKQESAAGPGSRVIRDNSHHLPSCGLWKLHSLRGRRHCEPQKRSGCWFCNSSWLCMSPGPHKSEHGAFSPLGSRRYKCEPHPSIRWATLLEGPASLEAINRAKVQRHMRTNCDQVWVKFSVSAQPRPEHAWVIRDGLALVSHPSMKTLL